MADELRGIENGLNLLYGRTPDPLPSDMIRPEDGYQMQIDPMLQASQDGPPSGPSSYDQQLASGQDPFGVQGLQLGRSPMAGWYLPVEQGGLGLAGPGPSQGQVQGMAPEDILARELFGDNVQLSHLDRHQLRSSMANGGLMQLAGRHEQIAQQAKQLEEQKRQHMFQQATGIFTNKDLPWSQRKKLLQADSANPVARIYANIGDEKLAADFENVVNFLDPEDVAAFQKNPDEFVRSVGGLAGVEAKLDVAKERQKAHVNEMATTAKERQEAVEMDDLFAKYKNDRASMTRGQLGRLNEYVTKQEKHQLEVQELDQRIKNLGLEGQHKQLELARGKAPVISPHFTLPSGESGVYKTDPVTGKQELISGVPMNRTQTQDLDPKFTPEQAARVSAMNMTLNNVSDLRDKLVPDGKTVDRRTLFTSMFGGLPFTEGRDVERYIEDAIETKLRLQTGAAANKDEVKKEAAKFKPNQLDSDDTIIGKFDKLERYMQDTFNVLDPSGVVRARLGSAGGNIGAPPIPFDTAYEDLKKKRPNWSQKEIFRELQRRGVKPE